jgi:hypothetical protein
MYSRILYDLKIYHNIVSCVQYFLVKFQLDLKYGLKNMSDLAKLVNKYFKTKFKPNLVHIINLINP